MLFHLFIGCRKIDLNIMKSYNSIFKNHGTHVEKFFRRPGCIEVYIT